MRRLSCFGSRMAMGWIAAFGLLLGGAISDGCQSETSRSLAALELWMQRIQNFYRQHQKWPDRLEDLQDSFASQEEFRQALRNPVTGADPGYEYVKPPRGVAGTALADRVVMLYQLREGERVVDLPVGYVCGQARLLQSTDITDTVPNWQPFRPPEAPIEVAFPARPKSAPEEGEADLPGPQPKEDSRKPEKSKPPDSRQGVLPPPAQDSSVWSYRASFCGLEYMLVGMQSALFYRAAQADPYQLMNLLCVGLTKEHQVQVRSREKILLQERPGLDVEMLLPQHNHQLRVRWCLAGDRLYCLSVAGPEGTLNEENVGIFFQSFRLLPP